MPSRTIPSSPIITLELKPAEDRILTIITEEAKPMTIKQIGNRVPYSEIYVRKIVEILENRMFIRKTDGRQPYQYVATNNEQRKELVSKFVDMLEATDVLPDTPAIIVEIRKVPKEHWRQKVTPVLKSIIEAIELADSDDSRIPTL